VDWGRPGICAAIVENDFEAVRNIGSLVDLFEVRIDLIGSDWTALAGQLGKPWIACNRRAAEGGSWQGSESGRIEELLKAVELGADIVDIELATPGIEEIIKELKGKADCLLSYHNLEDTPPPGEMQDVVKKQLDSGADICKVVTTARSLADNIAVLWLIKGFPQVKVVSFAMGDMGQISRVLCPLAGSYFTYASVKEGRESAAGQLTVKELREIYESIGVFTENT
jgi:3-dehydroquinate dehydratase-1